MPLDAAIKFQMGELSVEVNWNEAVTPCRKFKFKIKNETAILDYEDLYSMLFMFADINEKEQLIPIQTTKIVMAKRQAKLRANKDFKKGDIIITTYEYPISEEMFYKLRIHDKTLQLSNKSAESHFAGGKKILIK